MAISRQVYIFIGLCLITVDTNYFYASTEVPAYVTGMERRLHGLRNEPWCPAAKTYGSDRYGYRRHTLAPDYPSLPANLSGGNKTIGRASKIIYKGAISCGRRRLQTEQDAARSSSVNPISCMAYQRATSIKLTVES